MNQKTTTAATDDPCARLGREANLLAQGGAYQAALDRCEQALRHCPASASILRLRGNLRFSGGDIAGGIDDLSRVIAIRPSCVECWYERGSARVRAGEITAALEDLHACLQLDADFGPALSVRAFVLSRLSRYPEALADICRTIDLRGGNDADLHNRAVLLTAMGRYREAIADYEQALALNPASGGTHNNLAWLLATVDDPSVRDGDRAVQHARRALAAGVNGAWLDTLAAALAETGDFEGAVAAEERAYEMSQAKNDAFRRRIEIYRGRISYAAYRRHNAKGGGSGGGMGSLLP